MGSLSDGAKRDEKYFGMQVSQHISMLIIALYAVFIVFQLRTHKKLFNGDDDDDDEEEQPKFSFVVAFVGIGIVAVLIAILSDYLVSTVEIAADTLRLSKHFIALILIPIVGNVAEHASAIIMAFRGKMDIAVGIALGSSVQIIDFAFPFTVVVSWVLGYSLSMAVPSLLLACLVGSAILTYVCIADGTPTYLSGLVMLSVYLLLAITFLDAPDN